MFTKSKLEDEFGEEEGREYPILCRWLFGQDPNLNY